jgi:hypothetical protein
MDEVAEQVARAGLGPDRQVHLVEVDHQAEQVQVQRAERQVEDRAGRIDGRHGYGHRHAADRTDDGTRGIPHGAAQRADRRQALAPGQRRW